MIWRCSMRTTDCTRSVRSAVRHACGAALWIGQWLIAQRPAQRARGGRAGHAACANSEQNEQRRCIACTRHPERCWRGRDHREHHLLLRGRWLPVAGDAAVAALPRLQGLHCRDPGVDRDPAARRNGAVHAGAEHALTGGAAGYPGNKRGSRKKPYSPRRPRARRKSTARILTPPPPNRAATTTRTAGPAIVPLPRWCRWGRAGAGPAAAAWRRCRQPGTTPPPRFRAAAHQTEPPVTQPPANAQGRRPRTRPEPARPRRARKPQGLKQKFFWPPFSHLLSPWAPGPPGTAPATAERGAGRRRATGSAANHRAFLKE
jgi:hypothetical protein